MNDALKAANDRAMVELVKQSVIAWMNDYAHGSGALVLHPLLACASVVVGDRRRRLYLQC
jgi:hypothetical protein